MELICNFFDLINDDFQINVKEETKKALNNDIESIIKLTWHYYTNDEDNSLEKTIEYLLQATKCGNVDAYIELAELYKYKTTILSDDWYNKALFYYDEAINKGSVDALVFKGNFYIELQEDLTIDLLEKSIDCLNEAIKKENVIALILLGDLYVNYYEKLNIEISLALKCYETALEKGYKPSTIKIADYYKKLNDYQKAEQYYKQSNDSKSIYGLIDVTLKLNNKNEEALKTYLDKAQNNDTDALLSLGHCYNNVLGVAHDSKKAYEYYQKAMDNGNVDAIYHVAIWHLTNYIEYEKGIELLKKAADKNHLIAQNKIANHYFALNDYKNSFKYYKLAADKGCKLSATELSNFYLIGLSVEKDFDLYVKFKMLGDLS